MNPGAFIQNLITVKACRNGSFMCVKFEKDSA